MKIIICAALLLAGCSDSTDRERIEAQVKANRECLAAGMDVEIRLVGPFRYPETNCVPPMGKNP
jgi:hypothetical protein